MVNPVLSGCIYLSRVENLTGTKRSLFLYDEFVGVLTLVSLSHPQNVSTSVVISTDSNGESSFPTRSQEYISCSHLCSFFLTFMSNVVRFFSS